MKKLLIITILVIMCFSFYSCGPCRALKDELSYKGLSGKKVELKLYSGGVMVWHVPLAKITYSTGDTQAIMFKVDGQEYFWQGEALVTWN